MYRAIFRLRYGLAVTLSPWKALLIFTVLGIGMAFPYLLLAYYPQWLRYLPKPGGWMVTFKEAMGFLMFGTVIWLLWVFGAQTSTVGLILLLYALFFLALGSWIYGKWSPPVHSKMARTISYALTFLCLAASGYIISRSVSNDIIALSSLQQSHENKIWQPFSESKIANLRKKGVPVFVDFTAKWCLICQANHWSFPPGSRSQIQSAGRCPHESRLDKKRPQNHCGLEEIWPKRSASLCAL